MSEEILHGFTCEFVHEGDTCKLVDVLVDENRELRELVRSVLVLRYDPVYKWLDATTAEVCGKSFTEQARELGVEVDE